MPAATFYALAKAPWNPAQEPELHKWLDVSLGPEAQERLKSMGNVVFHRMAHLALSVIERSMRA